MKTGFHKFRISAHKTREQAIEALLCWIDVHAEEDMEIDFNFATGLYDLYIPAEDA